jgi:carbonic anhydrase/acetyltransferase-like protein (isoleucine patch superfamily)
MDADWVDGCAGRVFAFGNSQPRLCQSVWVAPGAMLIGDVSVGEGSSIWFNCVLRADVNTISIGRGSNIQDGSIVHADPGPMSVDIGDQ